MTKKSNKQPKIDERGAAQCKACNRKAAINFPNIVETEGLFYAQCPKCKYYDMYEFLAITAKRVIEVWNDTMLSNNTKTDRRAR